MFKNLKKSYLKFILIFLLISTFILINNQNYKKLFRPLYHKLILVYNNFTPDKIKALNKILFNKVDHRAILNDYNTSFLPDTFSKKLKYKFVKLDFIRSEKIFTVESYANKYRPSGINYSLIDFIDKENILFSIKNGEFYKTSLKTLNENTKLTLKDVKIIKTNLVTTKILDSLIYENNLYISHVFWNDKKKCSNLKISFAEIKPSSKELIFKDYFFSKECSEKIWAGRIQPIKFNNYNGFLVTTSDTMGNIPTGNSQKENSIFGKTLYLKDKNEYEIFSYGHRNAQGLFVDNAKQIIISTEHGPRGGDEINLIQKGKNYGWPISSYGYKYSEPINDDLNYSDNHKKYGFEEPIFSFIPSIGISEIIPVPKKFNEFWKNNFLISSLWGASIYRTRMSDDHKKIIYYEKIYVGKRIRDLKYSLSYNNFLLSVEDYWKGSASLCIISN